MDLLAWLGAWPGAAAVRQSGTAYLLLNASHILGLALLIGAIVPLDIRLLGLFRAVPVAALAAVLPRISSFGLGLALISGAWLFTVRPIEYAGNAAFLWKSGLLLAALANVAAQHLNPRYAAALKGGAIAPSVRALAALSITLWLAVLVAGRWIGFV